MKRWTHRCAMGTASAVGTRSAAFWSHGTVVMQGIFALQADESEVARPSLVDHGVAMRSG
jgi:hypothetical protein